MKAPFWIAVFLLVQQVVLAQFADTLSGTFKVRKPGGESVLFHGGTIRSMIYQDSLRNQKVFSDTFKAGDSPGWNNFRWNTIGNTVLQGYSLTSVNISASQGMWCEVLKPYFPTPGLQYPDVAKALGITGTVYVSYQWDENGRSTNVQLVKGVHPYLDKAALTYVQKLKPGDQTGDEMNVQYTIPIKFYPETKAAH
jgi:TonB family protein